MAIYDRNGLIGVNKRLEPINETTETLRLNVGPDLGKEVRINIVNKLVVSEHGPRIKVYQGKPSKNSKYANYEVHRNTTRRPIVELVKNSLYNPDYEDAIFGLVRYMYSDIIAYYDMEVSDSYI